MALWLQMNLSGKRNKQSAGPDPGSVMTIISYKNSGVFGLDGAQRPVEKVHFSSVGGQTWCHSSQRLGEIVKICVIVCTAARLIFLCELRLLLP